MQALREQIYSQLETGTTYSMSELAHQYKVSQPVIEVQLQRLRDEGKKIKISEDEVSILLSETHWIWPFAFWVFVGLIFVIFFSGVIDS